MNRSIAAGLGALTLAVVVLLLGLVIASPAPAAHPTTYGVQKCSKPRVEPKMIVLTCADVGLFVKMKKWTHWNGHNGAGKGTVYAKQCVPDCASGHYETYAAKVKVTKPRKRTCNGRKGLRMFTRIKFDFKGGTPSNVPTKGSMDCY